MTLSKQIDLLKRQVKNLEIKLLDLSKNTESKLNKPYSKVKRQSQVGNIDLYFDGNVGLWKGGLKLRLIKEGTVDIKADKHKYIYIRNHQRKLKVYIMVRETTHKDVEEEYTYGVVSTVWEAQQYEENSTKCRFLIGYGAQYGIKVHYKIYESMIDFGDWEIIE